MLFVSFGSNWRYTSLAKRMLSNVHVSYPSAEIRVFGRADLPPSLIEYASRFPRGFGFWVWKAWIVHHVMASRQEGDLVVYVDARSGIPTQRIPWLDSMAANPSIDLAAWHSSNLERKWTSVDLMQALSGESASIFECTGQYIATFFGLRVNALTRELVGEWFTFQQSNASLVRAESFVYPNHSDFEENRWDQSVFSLLIKRYAEQGLSVLAISDEEVAVGSSIFPHREPHPDVLYPLTHSKLGKGMKALVKGTFEERRVRGMK